MPGFVTRKRPDFLRIVGPVLRLYPLLDLSASRGGTLYDNSCQPGYIFLGR